MENIIKYNDEKFKSILISLNIMLPLKRCDVSKNALIAMLLKKENERYGSEKEINKQLYALYNSTINVNVDKVGNYYNIGVHLEIINPKFLPEDITEKAIDLLIEIATNPKMKEGLFEETVFEREKIALMQKINEERDDKKRYALKRLEELVFEDSEYGISALGKYEDVQKITLEEISNYYINSVKKAQYLICICGNLSGLQEQEQKLIERVSRSFSNVKRIIRSDYKKVKTDTFPLVTIENQDISQSILTIGLIFEDLKKEEVYSALVYDRILGGTPAAKMFQNIREKNSLAYFAKSTFNKQKGCIYMYAGISPKNYEKTKQLMEEQLVLISKGQITDTELAAAKESIVSDYKQIKDSKYQISQLGLSNIVFWGEDKKIEDMISRIQDIKIEDILEISKKIKIKDVFLLGGKENA